ncbi:MAG: acetyl-CoA synthetase, partial [bacterium]
MKRKIFAFLFLLISISFLSAQEARLLRQPHICQDEVVFVYGGDLWKVSSQGGKAEQLTTFKGLELFPRFSPDGKKIAFSGMYSGNRQIYVMLSQGGEPEQLTYYPDVGEMPPRGGWDNIPVDWTPDSKKILYSSNRTPYGKRVSKYFLVDASGEGMAEPLQLPEGGPASLSEDGKKIAYSIKSREFRTWKRYKAGRAQDI